MSETLRIALVAEGITDKLVIEAAVKNLLGDQPFIMRLLQPEESLPLDLAAPSLSKGMGWGGVYLWCLGLRERNDGHLAEDILFLGHDLLIMHLDADVAGKRYSDCGFDEPAQDLPCELPCPPATDTTNRLRTVLLRWLGETSTPAGTVICTPSKNSETWVIAALFPKDAEMIRKGWECHPDPETRLRIKPIKFRVRKSKDAYRAVQEQISANWPNVRELLSEAERFSRDFAAACTQHSDCRSVVHE